MSVFVHKHSRVIIQGFTGQHATFHAEEAMQNGTTGFISLMMIMGIMKI